MNKLYLLPLVVLAGACASVKPEPFVGPNGNPAYEVNCSGGARNFSWCHETAAELCPAGYTTIDTIDELVAVQAGWSQARSHRRQLIIECDP